MGKPSDLFRSDRYRSQARLHSDQRITKPITGDSTGGAILPLYQAPDTLTKAGRLDHQDAGRGPPSGPTASGQGHGGDESGGGDAAEDGGVRAGRSSPQGSAAENPGGGVPKSTTPPALRADTEAPRYGDTAIKSTPGQGAEKPPIAKRMLAGSKRFLQHTKKAIFRGWINLLLVFVPIGIIAEALNLNASLVFAMNAIAIVPLAGLLSFATECVAARMGDTLGALLNVSFGNAVELIIFIIALVKNEIAIVQASLLGSILANLLLILGMAFLFGGLRYREQIYNSTVTQMSACLLSLSVMSLLLPTAFHASFSATSAAAADRAVLKISRGTSVILLVIYVLYLLFQLKSHAYMYESTPQAIIDEESHPGVLADMLNSSSSSSDASSTDSTDTDTSGSAITTGQKLRKKMFRRRRRRQSSASISSTTASSVIPSVVSSPPLERAGSYLDSQPAAAQSTRGESALGVIASGDEADAGIDQPRIRDFVNTSEKVRNDDDVKFVERKKHKRKHFRKQRGTRHHHDEEKDALEREETETPKTGKAGAPPRSQPRVGFADDPDRTDNQPEPQPTAPEQPPGRLTFNMRGLSSKVVYPALPSYLSNTVFTTPPPRPDTAKQPVQPALSRARSEAYGLRRTNSLPDRLNRQLSAPRGGGPSSSSTTATTAPITPLQHRASSRLATSPIPAIAGKHDGHEAEALMSRTAAIVLLLLTTSLVAVCAEFMVSAIPVLIADSPVVSEAFIGLIILPIVGNAAEHVTAVTVAAKNKMDLAIGVAVGSSIQIALFVTPIIVLLGWALGRDMSLYFNLFETVSLFVTVSLAPPLPPLRLLIGYSGLPGLPVSVLRR
ncbi:hypothetical protein LTR54_016461 [Friedmanniomyces endolithicus]|uniref:Sodium/calcium exchanger membrane region domain-containing protein n=1 Tax=Friedmanniomyces endolithicus TaxID=329885 RepID=A0AAN6FG46_9PEZI|nr:hypothetical protein LTR82_012438 [Friedmanniomyces endolithicus]KAK0976532.1 hypothetical protein LTR54_016461 [Friedmanniomyces endolithicus]